MRHTATGPTFPKDDLQRPESQPLVTHTQRDTRHAQLSSSSEDDDQDNPSTRALPWYNPHSWSLRKKLLAGTFCIAAIIGIIVGAVEGSRARRYPDYSPLRYRLVDVYAGEGFFERFGYFEEEDPTKGFVRYVNRSTALAQNLTYATPYSSILRVDATTANTTAGRNSVRIESTTTYDDGLFIFDILHTPYGCGTWPALWLTDGYNWPLNGEIDVLEATNNGSDGNAVTLHTKPGCSMDVRRKETGDAIYTTCDNSTNGNAGCGVKGPSATYGAEMNANGGGVYALEIRPAGIRAWFFPREAIPADIANASTSSSTTPDPSTWGTALADFPNTSCDIPSHFKNQSIIANIDLCGDYGGRDDVYKDQFGCPGNCTEFVARNPDNFSQAYWEFGGFWVYGAV
ncbi:concanavalin A-like lectin/glucanase domain-containing protein [Aspergillus pseudoustus]|uniref:Concanavalin A-like lectin/glucanase domain-containing protein n=1 Tax=Aspergillus pseudoustus TaxID=1810923 RepID=A0ABR4IU45_9EURO